MPAPPARWSEVRGGRRALARRVPERGLGHAAARHHAVPFELALVVDLRIELVARASPGHVHGGEGDVLLCRGRPFRRGDGADDVLVLVVDVGRARRLVALDVEPHEPVARALLLLLEERATAVETGLAEVHEAPEVELERRARAVRHDRLVGRVEIHLGLDEPRLDARDLERVRAHRADAVDPALVEQRVPQPERLRRVDPQLVAEVAGEAGARHRELGALKLEEPDLEGLQVLHARAADRLQHGAAGRALQREAGDVVRVLDDGDVEAEGVARQPVELAFLRAEAVDAFLQVEDGAVVDHLAVVVAPDAVADPAGLDPGDVARDQPVEECERVGAGDQVLGHRRQVEHRAGVPDRGILELLVEEGVGGRVVLPAMPLVQRVERGRARVERRLPDRLAEMLLAAHLVLDAHAARPGSRTAFAALRPAEPITPPPGWQPAPQRNSPPIGIAYCAAPGTGLSIMNWSSASSPWCQWPPVMRNSRSMSAGSRSSDATTWRRRPGAWRSSTASARPSSSRRAPSPFARGSNGAYSTTAESTCLPGGASDLSASDGIVTSSAGSGEHWPYFAASKACSR